MLFRSKIAKSVSIEKPHKPFKPSLVRRKCKKIRFEITAPEAEEVVLTGDFAAWSREGIVMKKNKEGLWAAEVLLPSGRYEYKFIVDQQWRTDPTNHLTSLNSSGTQNSIKQVTV